MGEHELYKQVAVFLQVKYPDVFYRFDLAADLKLTIGQARKHKMIHPYRGYPDLFIAKVMNGSCGLFIELKKDGTRIKKKNGEWASPHIKEQSEVLEKLRAEGYRAEFAVGFEEAISLIDEYLGGE